jgi:hypothetical protein
MRVGTGSTNFHVLIKHVAFSNHTNDQPIGTYYVTIGTVNSTSDYHFRFCTALISKALALILNCKCGVAS